MLFYDASIDVRLQKEERGLIRLCHFCCYLITALFIGILLRKRILSRVQPLSHDATVIVEGRFFYMALQKWQICLNHEQNPRVVLTILITNADNATMQLDDPHYDGLFNLS